MKKKPEATLNPLKGLRDWKLEDDMLALYLYKVEQEKNISLTQKDMDELALAFGISISDMQARKAHYKQLDGKGNLAGGNLAGGNLAGGNLADGSLADAPDQARQVWDAYWDLSAESLMERLTGRR